MKDTRLEKTENRPTREDTRVEARVKRIPISGERNILGVTGIRPDYHACWVNDKNVPAFQDAGYTFVDNDVSFGAVHIEQGNPLGARYARNVGMGTTAYLMEIPQEYYDEDRENEAQQVDSMEASMKRDARASGLDHGDLELITYRR